jgi:TP901 family phage tail tape measure protein
MARKIDVIFKFVDEFTSQFNKTMGSLTAGTEKAKKAWKQVDKAGKAISGVGTAMTAAVTAPLVGLGAVSAKEYGEVDKSLRLVQQTMGSTPEQAKQLESAIKSAAANSVYGMQDAADASLNFARQGWNAAQAADMITPALDLAAGTATDLSTVTGGLGNTLKAFGAGADEATKYTDMMAKAQAQANTDVTGLFDAMSIAGSTANSVGWGFSDLATLTGVFGDHSISASEGATALNTGLMRLASPAKQGSEMLKQLGINVFDADGKLKSMPDTMAELQKGFTGLSDQQQLAAASAIFGKNQASKWITLINGPTGEALQGLKGNIEGATGASHDMAEALLSGPGGALEKLKSSFDVFKYSAGSVVAEVVTPFINKATEMIDKFNQMDPAQQKQIVKWAAIAAAAGPAIAVFGQAISIIGKLGTGFNGLIKFGSKAAGSFKAFHSAGGLVKTAMTALTSPLGAAIGIIALVGVVILSVVTHFKTFKSALANTGGLEKLKASFDNIKRTITPMIPVFKKIADVVGNTIAGAAGFAVGAFASLLSGVVDAVSGILKVVSGLAEGIWKLLHGDLGGALDGFKLAFSGAVEFIKGLFDGLFGTIKSIADAISKIKFPSWGGFKGIKMETTEARAIGDVNWKGGPVRVHEEGGEIIDLPHGTRIYPHDRSIAMARASGGLSFNIAKLADSIIVREDADIDKIADALVRKLRAAAGNMGGVPNATLA